MVKTIGEGITTIGFASTLGTELVGFVSVVYV